MKIFSFLLVSFIGSSFISFGQKIETPPSLKVDTSLAFIQFYSNNTIKKLASHFENVNKDKLVFIHYGGSHIQAEYPTTVARKKFHDRFGNGGRGLIFNYGAAKTYSSINYTSTFSGSWKYNKSYLGRKADIPLGICGMTVESIDTNAILKFNFKEEIVTSNHLIHLFFENDSISNNIEIYFNNILIDDSINQVIYKPYGLSFKWNQNIKSIELKVKSKTNGKRFRFYGMSIENEENTGIVYHSTGVGAAAFRSVLYLDELPIQAEIVKPDIVLLDFGTNDILYTNSIDSKLESQIEKAIQKFKTINPEILIVLTSTQDLFYKGKPITAGIEFRDLMDTIARKNDCLFWNWYDISGGLNTIRDWNKEGYAQKDCIHLTKKGYEIKGKLLYDSFINSYNSYINNKQINYLNIKGKTYDPTNNIDSSLLRNNTEIHNIKTNTNNTQVDIDHQLKIKTNKTHKVRSGETLSYISEKNKVTVIDLKKENGLKSDIIHTGQILKIPSITK